MKIVTTWLYFTWLLCIKYIKGIFQFFNLWFKQAIHSIFRCIKISKSFSNSTSLHLYYIDCEYLIDMRWFIFVSKSFCELYFVYLPFFCCKSSFYMTCKCLTWFRISSIFEVVVTDRELSIWFLKVWTVNDTDVTTSEYWTFLGVTSDCELSQI